MRREGSSQARVSEPRGSHEGRRRWNQQKHGAMGKVILDMSMSLDGFIAGPNIAVDRPMGEGGERLHHWLFGSVAGDDAGVIDRSSRNRGAVVMGRTTFDVGEGPWGEDGAFQLPCFVVTHQARQRLTRGRTTFTFVTEGIESALAQARVAAGDKDVWLMGANADQQYLQAGLVDELRIHLIPVLLGAGVRLFEQIGAQRVELERTRVTPSPGVTHLTFRIIK